MKKALIITFTLLMMANICVAWNYHNSSNHFSISLPDNWVETPKEAISETANELKRTIKNKVKMPDIEAGFHINGKSYFELPYFMLEVSRNKSSTIKEMRDLWGVKPSHNVQKSLEEAVGKLEFISSIENKIVYFDEEKKIAYIINKITMSGKKRISLTAICFGHNINVKMHFYSKEDDFASNRKSFSDIANSLRFDSGYEYKEPSTQSYMNWEFVIAAIIFTIFGNEIFKRKFKGENKPT